MIDGTTTLLSKISTQALSALPPVKDALISEF